MGEGDRHALNLNSEVEVRGLAGELFLSRVLGDSLPHVRIDHWPTTARSLGGVIEPRLRVCEEGRDALVADLDGSFVHVSVTNGWVYVEAAGPDEATVDAAVQVLRERLPSPDPSAAHEVNVTFWTYGAHGPQPSARPIAVPEWAEIRDNYAAGTRAQLDAMMSDFQPAHGGQLVLWHGRAGTGKTFGLRALAWEWRNWAELHYIVDPDTFFGQHADYLMNVLLQPAYMTMALGTMHGGTAQFFPGESAPDPEIVEKAWKVLLLEDTGELLSADARAMAGQGLSRFLNVVDGLIGQGLRVLVLVTTNEEVKRLHPAVARPGRCAANVEFAPLERAEATAWLEEHGLTGEADGSTTLASLYARLEGFDVSRETPSTGFAG